MKPTAPPCVTGCAEVHIGRVQGVENWPLVAVGVGAKGGRVGFGDMLSPMVVNCSGWVPMEGGVATLRVEVVSEDGAFRACGDYDVDGTENEEGRSFHVQMPLRPVVADGAGEEKCDAVVSMSLTLHTDLLSVGLPLLDVYEMYCSAWNFRVNKTVAAALPEVADPTAHLHYLDLSGTYLGPTGLYPVACTLLHCDALRILNLNDLGMKAEGLALLCDALAHHRELHSLLLSGNDLFEASSLVVYKIVASHPELVRVEWDRCHFSDTAAAKLSRRLAVNGDRRLRETPALVGTLPLPPSHLEGLHTAWLFLTEPPYISPESAKVSARLNQFMVHIAQGFEVYKNPGVRALVAPRVDDLPVKQRIVSVNDVTFKSSLYSAMMIGVAEVLQTRGSSLNESTASVLRHLGHLFASFGVGPVHLTHFTTLSYDALLACGAREFASPLIKNSWQSALSIVAQILIPSPYPVTPLDKPRKSGSGGATPTEAPLS